MSTKGHHLRGSKNVDQSCRYPRYWKPSVNVVARWDVELMKPPDVVQTMSITTRSIGHSACIAHSLGLHLKSHIRANHNLFAELGQVKS